MIAHDRGAASAGQAFRRDRRRATREPQRIVTIAARGRADSARLDDADFAVLREHGFTDEDVWDIGAIAAFFALSNRMANLISMQPNPEFYLLGRVPRS